MKVVLSRPGPFELIPKLVLALGAVLLTAACASESGATNGNAVASNTNAAGETLICRREQVTGTNFKQRICLTSEEWKALQASERRSAREFGRQTSERSGQAAAAQGNAAAGAGI